MTEINVENTSGRLETIMLGTLFSGYRMREERAFSIWKRIKMWFQQTGYTYQDVFSLDLTKHKEFRKETVNIGYSITFLKYMNATMRNLSQVEYDLNNLVAPNDWKRTVQRIQSYCKGIDQKAFWVARVMKQKGAWDIPGELCCVSDSHVKAFLRKTGFVTDDSDLFYNSQVIWTHFNADRPTHFYDLPIFRFARERHKQCKRCSKKECTLEKMTSCQ